MIMIFTLVTRQRWRRGGEGGTTLTSTTSWQGRKRKAPSSQATGSMSIEEE